MTVRNDECRCAFIKGIYSDKNNVLRCTTCYRRIEDRSKIPDFSSNIYSYKDDIKMIIIIALILSLMFGLLFVFPEIYEANRFEFYDNFTGGDFYMKYLIKFLVITLIVMMFQNCWAEGRKKSHSRNGFAHMDKVIIIPKGETRVGITNWGHTKNKKIVWVYDGPIMDCYLNWVPLDNKYNSRPWRLEPVGTHKVYEIIDFDFETGSITIRERI